MMNKLRVLPIKLMNWQGSLANKMQTVSRRSESFIQPAIIWSACEALRQNLLPSSFRVACCLDKFNELDGRERIPRAHRLIYIVGVYKLISLGIEN